MVYTKLKVFNQLFKQSIYSVDSKVIKGNAAKLSMTRMQHRTYALMILGLFLLAFISSNSLASGIQFESTAIVSTIIDGSSFTNNSGQTIKLAAIDTPQSSQPGYNEAKNYLSSILQGKTVYIDIDNLTSTDQYGRLMCVVYIDYNSTHYENVNMAMIVNSYAVPSSDLNHSEFNPSNWSWFVLKETPVSSPTASTLVPTNTPSVTPYTPPPMPTPTPVMPEFTILTILIIMGLTTLISAKLHKKKS